MAEAVVCAACGAKIKEGRQQCLRCGEKLVANAPAAPPDSRNFAEKYRGPLTLGATAVSILVVLVVASRQAPPEAPANVVQASGSVASVPRSNANAISPAVSTSAPVQTSFEPATSLDSARAGAASYAQGDFEGALAQLEKAVQKTPDDGRALNNLGQALVRLGRAKEALPHFVRATELQPSEWAPRFNLGHAYGALGDWGHAIPEYQKAAELFPDDYVTRYNLAMALHKSGQEERAVAEFVRAIDLAPSEPSFRLSLAISYERLKKPAEAAQAYEDYLALAPTAPNAAEIKTHIETLRKPA